MVLDLSSDYGIGYVKTPQHDIGFCNTLNPKPLKQHNIGKYFGSCSLFMRLGGSPDSKDFRRDP